jgi:methyl-accepting chemotaxis protein
MSRPRLSITTKLLAAFGVLIVFLVATMAVTFQLTGSLRDDVRDVGRTQLPSVQMLGELTTEMRQFRVAQLEHSLSDAEGKKELDGEIAEVRGIVDTLLGRLSREPEGVAQAALTAKTRADWQRYQKLSAPFLAASRANDPEGAYAILDGPADGAYDTLKSDVVTLSRGIDRHAAASVAAASDRTTRARVILAAILAAAVIAAVLASLLLARSLRRRLTLALERLRALSDQALDGLAEGLRALADGDLRVRVQADVLPLGPMGSDEINDLAKVVDDTRERTLAAVKAFNASMAELGALVGQVGTAAAQVDHGSHAVADSSDVAGRSVGEIVEAVGDVAIGAQRQVEIIGDANERTRRTVEAAGAAEQLANQGQQDAEEAHAAIGSVGEANRDVATAIRTLSERSEAIGGIVDSITGIADQTNLLALNAAIEAARAGEHGRGFAVVAGQVHDLAEESRSAASEISQLIGEIQRETRRSVDLVEDGNRRSEHGIEVVQRSRESFARIEAAIVDVRDLVAGIAEATAKVAAVSEQSSATAQQISSSGHETSASAQQTAATAQELARTAEELNALVGRFQTAGV